ncbi:MAG: hypothetical protein U5J98_05330 [Halobacteriales archaeon]|nr:hypothetical protein [Halobacteriales archaeon]
MATRVNYSGFVIAGLGFFLTRFTVTLALYEDPIRFLFAGLIPLMLGLGLAAFGVALAVADVDEGIVRTVAAWAVIGAVTMFVLALLTLFGSGAASCRRSRPSARGPTSRTSSSAAASGARSPASTPPGSAGSAASSSSRPTGWRCSTGCCATRCSTR